jgi:hypothetical protein
VAFQKVQVGGAGSPGYYKNISGNGWDEPTTSAFIDRDNYSFDVNYAGGAPLYGLTWQGRYFAGESSYFTKNPDRQFGNFYESDYHTFFQGAQWQTTFSRDWLELTGGADWNYYDDSQRDTSDWSNERKLSTMHNFAPFALLTLRFFLTTG